MFNVSIIFLQNYKPLPIFFFLVQNFLAPYHLEEREDLCYRCTTLNTAVSLACSQRLVIANKTAAKLAANSKIYIHPFSLLFGFFSSIKSKRGYRALYTVNSGAPKGSHLIK